MFAIQKLLLTSSFGFLLTAHAAEIAPNTQEIIQALKPGATRNLKRMTPAASAPAAIAPPVAASAPQTSEASAPAIASAPAEIPASTPASTPDKTASKRVFSFSLDIPFEANSARLAKNAEASLSQLRNALQSDELKIYRFLIEGHTDAKGSAHHNFKLTEARAQEVRRYLIKQGIAADRLEASGMGSTIPANLFDPNSAENRRIRIVLIE